LARFPFLPLLPQASTTQPFRYTLSPRQDGETYVPYPIINTDTVDSSWRAANVAFKRSRDESRDLSYALEVVFASHEANAELRVGQQRKIMRRLPEGVIRISERVVVVPRSDSQLLSPLSVGNQPTTQTYEPPAIENFTEGWVQGRITRHVDEQTAGFITGDDGTSYYFMASKCLFKKTQVHSGDRVIFQVAAPLKANGNPRAVRVFGVPSEIELEISDPLSPGKFCFVKLFSDVEPGDMHSIFVINLSNSIQQGRLICTIDINDQSRSRGPVAKILN
jgi:hypothetical protein